jgi:putative tricarboxylic transport membrane protein
MDVWTSLLRLRHRRTPINLMWAFLGCLVGTAVGVLPASGPRWPWPCCCP